MSSTTRRPFGRSSERGQVLVLFAGGVFAILVVAALAFDVGMMLVERRDQQNAADAAALAGARYVLVGDCVAPAWVCPEARAAAFQIASANGFAIGDPSVTVEVHIPPTNSNGRYTNLPNFIEVEIQSTRASIFAGVIGVTTWDVGVFAVATNGQNVSFSFGMLALNKTKCAAIKVTGTGVVDSAGNIQSNSNGTECLDVDGNGNPVGFLRSGDSTVVVHADDATCRSAGEVVNGNNGEMTCTVVANSYALPDPLQNLKGPNKPGLAAAMVHVDGEVLAGDGYPKSCPGDTDTPPSETTPLVCKLAQGGNTWPGETWILYPGLYPGGLEISADTTAYLMPGIYWIGGGGLAVKNGGSIVSIATEAHGMELVADATWGGGVLIYNSKLAAAAGGPIDLNGGGATILLKPFDVASGDPDDKYNKIVIYQDRTVCATMTLNGGDSDIRVEGLIYLPCAELKVNGSDSDIYLDQIIADSYVVNGSGGSVFILKDDLFIASIVAAGLVD